MKQALLLLALILFSCSTQVELEVTSQAVEEEWWDANLFETQCAPAWYEYCWSGNHDTWGQRFHRTCFHPLRGFWEIVGPCITFGSYFPLSDDNKETL